MPSLRVILLISIATIPFAWAGRAEIQVQPDRIVPSENKSLSLTCCLPWGEDLQKDVVSVLKIELVKSTARTEANSATSEPEVLLATVRIDGTEATLNVENDLERYSVEGSIDPANLSASFLQLNTSQAAETDAGPYACIFSLLTSSFVMAKERAEMNVTVADGKLPDLTAELWEKEEAGELRLDALQAKLELLEVRVEELSSYLTNLTKAHSELLDKILRQMEGLAEHTTSSATHNLIEVPSAQGPAPSGQAADQSGTDRAPANAHVYPTTFAGGTSTTVSSARRQCFACGNLAAKRPCNGTELKDKKPVTCPAGKDYCMNVIFQTETSNSIYKGCVSEERCLQENNAASDACKSFAELSSVESRKCRFCCSSDGCNSSFKPSVDLVVPPA